MTVLTLCPLGLEVVLQSTVLLKPYAVGWPPMLCTVLFSTLDLQKQSTFTIGPEKTINGSLVYTIHTDLRKGDLAENKNIRFSCGAASYILTFEMVLPGG